MRRSASLIIPLSLILIYYAFWVYLVLWVSRQYPELNEYLPLGGIVDLAAHDLDTFEPVYTMAERRLLAPSAPIKLLLASVGTMICTIPISWVYFITSRARRIDQSFLQTILVLPIVVTGIAMIVALLAAVMLLPLLMMWIKPLGPPGEAVTKEAAEEAAAGGGEPAQAT